ncbi:MAG: hypothetical protein WCK49_00980 [Myxococcaceae bacterium]
MSDRVDANQSSQNIDRSIRIRGRELQKKQTNQEFQTKLATNQQLGANARVQVGSKQVLDQMAKGEEAEKTATPEQTTETPVPKKALQQEKSQKTEQKKTEKQASTDKHIEKKNEKTVLDQAVQRKNQQEQESGEFGGSSGGDFFQQAVTMGIATQKAEAVPGGPVKIPDEILNQIVEQVHAGVDAKGVSLFVIDLKPGVLGGGRIQISAQGKSVKLKFSGMDAVSRSQVKSAQGQLKERLGSKGLELSELEVV